MGVLFYEDGDKNSALGFYEQASRLEPNNPIFQKNLADYYYVELGRIEDALSLYVKILEMDNEDIECLVAAGTICAHIGKDDDARVFFNRVLEIEPWNQESANALHDLDQKKDPSCFTTDPRAAVQ
jgi:tetratricopeptide (TPR) repeat protein